MDHSWQQALSVATPRLDLVPCDPAAAATLARLVDDARIREPYRLARANAAAPLDWEQREHDWRDRRRLSLAVRERASAAVIGCLRLSDDQVGYFVDPGHWGRGVGSEIVAAAPALALRLGIMRLQALVVRENLRSRRVLEKAGFAFVRLETRQWTGGAGVQMMLRYQLIP